MVTAIKKRVGRPSDGITRIRKTVMVRAEHNAMITQIQERTDCSYSEALAHLLSIGAGHYESKKLPGRKTN